MSRFIVVPAPAFSPTRCVSCTANRDEHGFVDLMVDSEAVHGYDQDGHPVVKDGEVNFGHLYLCASCVGQAAAALGWLSPEATSELRDRIDTLEGETARLDEELEQERAPGAKVVSVAELAEYIKGGRA